MTEEIKTQLDALDSAVTGVNDVIRHLEDIKKIHSKVDEKSEETLNKLASVDEKIAEIYAIRDAILNAKNNIADEIQALKAKNDAFEKRFSQLENRISKIENSQTQSTVYSEKNTATQKENTTQTVTPPEKSELSQFFTSRGYEVIDKRQNGGALWVVGNESQLQPVIDEAKKEFDNLSFEYLAKGGKATKQRASWYTKDKR